MRRVNRAVNKGNPRSCPRDIRCDVRLAGTPIEGARVRLILLGEGGPGGAASRTDAQGRFTLRSLEAGTWRVLAGAAGFRRASVEVEVPRESRIQLVLREDPGVTLKPRVRVRAGSGVQS